MHPLLMFQGRIAAQLASTAPEQTKNAEEVKEEEA